MKVAKKASVVLLAACGFGFVIPSVLRSQGDGLQRIRQDAPYSFTAQVMQGGQTKDVTAEFNKFLDSHTAKGVVFHTRTHPVAKSPLGDNRAELELGGKAQLILITEITPQAMSLKHRYGDFGEPLYMVVQGSGKTKYAKDGREREIAWKANDLFAVPPGSWIEHSLAPGVNSARLLEYVGYGVNLFTKDEVEMDRGTAGGGEGGSPPQEWLTQTGPGSPLSFDNLKWPGSYFPDIRDPRPPLENRIVIDVTRVGHRTHPLVYINAQDEPATGDPLTPAAAAAARAARGQVHRHGGAGMYYILKGTGYDDYYRKDESPKRYEYTEGDIVGIPVGSYHHYHYNSSKTEPLRNIAVVPRYDEVK